MFSKEKHALLALFLVLFIDGMGQGLIFPILTNVIINPNAHEILYLATREERTIWYGVVVCSFFFAWFFGAAFLGDLSDRSGRKKALLICLGGAALGYLLSALAFWWHSIWLLVIGRLIYGFTAGSQPIAQASIADVSPPADKARNMGLILLAVTLGIMAGPIIGGFLSDPNLVGWFGDSTPLYFACALAIFNILYLKLFYEETAKVHGAVKINLFRAVSIFARAFKDQKLRYLSFAFLSLQIGWSIYYLYISVYLARVFNFASTTIGLFFAALGLGLAIGFAVLVRYVDKFQLKNVIAVGYLVLFFGLIATVLARTETLVWLAVVPATAGMATGYAYFMTLFSNAVPESDQGFIMGVTGAMVAFAAGFATLMATLIATFNTEGPLWLGSLFLLIGVIMIKTDKS